MPISKDGTTGEILFTPPNRGDLFSQTGVANNGNFAICDSTDYLKQIKFNPHSQTTNTTVTIASGANSANITLTLPTTTGTLALSGASTNSFTIMQPDLGTSPTAASSSDTLTFTSGDSTVLITGTASTKTLAFVVNPNLSSTSHYINKSGSGSALYVKALGTGDAQGLVLESSGGTVWNFTTTGTDFFIEQGTNVPIWVHSGNVSIYGGQIPKYNLDVLGGDTSTVPTAIFPNNINSTISCRNTSATANNFSAVHFSGSTGATSSTSVDSAILGIHEVHTDTAQTGSLAFCTRNAGSNLTEQIRITKDGNIKYSGAAYTTGAKSAALGTNCPATTETAPNTWLKFQKSDGTVIYVPAWA